MAPSEKPEDVKRDSAHKNGAQDETRRRLLEMIKRNESLRRSKPK